MANIGIFPLKPPTHCNIRVDNEGPISELFQNMMLILLGELAMLIVYSMGA